MSFLLFLFKFICVISLIHRYLDGIMASISPSRESPTAHRRARSAITGVAGNEVDVQVRHGLPRCWAIVDADVETIGPQFGSQPRLRLGHQLKQTAALGLGQPEKRGRHAAGV